MNRIIASVGLVALGAASVQAQSSVTTTPAKWWNVQATVRGFYDDNLNSVPHPTSSDRVWGYQLSPGVGITLGNDQTTFIADYTYSFLYYDHKPSGNTEHYDQDHVFNAALSHAFNERYKIRVHDSFTIGQEPDALRQDAAFHTPFRVAGDNIVNSGGVVFNAELTPIFGVEIGYDNAYYNYDDRFSQAGYSPAGSVFNPVTGLWEFDGGGSNSKNISSTGVVSPSLSGALDRIEQMPHISALWHVQPDTTASISYQFSQIDYTADEVIGGSVLALDPFTGIVSPVDPSGLPHSKDRDNRGHTLYVGLDHQFRPDFYGSVQAGATYYDYYNVDKSSFGPYARLALTYVYLPESSLTAGFQQGRAATDIIGGTTKDSLVLDAEDSVLYAVVHHRIIPHLYGNLNGSAQHSIFNGGVFDGKTEDFYEFGANLQYVFNANFSAHIGYDFNRLDSDIGGRSYSRNKVYIGATASY